MQRSAKLFDTFRCPAFSIKYARRLLDAMLLGIGGHAD
jgi:hypothetical protein